jgi:hypothetical protein
MAASPFDLSTTDLRGLTAPQLWDLAADVACEQHRRALEDADPNALIEDGFTNGFTQYNDVMTPWIIDGILVCPGLIVYKSRSSHDCTFVSVALPGEESGHWVWDAPDKIVNDVRIEEGPPRKQRSVALVVATEGLQVDLVTCKMRGGQHERQKSRDYRVERGELVLVTTRGKRVSAPSH